MIKKGIILISSAVMAAASCITNDRTMGSSFIPEDQIMKVKTASFDLPVSMAAPDSLTSLNTSYVTVGSINHEVLGKTNIGSAVFFLPVADSLEFGNSPEPVRFYIELEKSSSGNIWINDNSEFIPQNIYIHKMKKTILDEDKLYYNVSLKPEDYEETSINASSPVYFGGDSLRINLSLDYAREILATPQKELDSLPLFVKRHKGLYISAADLPQNLYGGRINNFAFSSTAYLKYSYIPEGKTERRDTMASFRIYGNVSSAYCRTFGNYGSHALASSSTNSENIYAEGISGIKPYIQASEIKKILTKIAEKESEETGKQLTEKNILIARASIILPIDNVIDDYEFVNTYPTQLFPCYKGRTTTDSVYYSVYPEISNTSAETGSLNRSLAHYKCDMTYHVSDLKNKDAEKITDSDNIWLFPIYTAQDIYGNTSYYPNTYTYYYQILNGNGAERKPELKIVYAVIEE